MVNRYENDVLNTTEQGLRFLDDIGSWHATLHLDTYRMNRFVLDHLAAATP